ncbi:MAG: DNA-3-methyladenine glycosylase I [Eubacteriales bacterium]|nr:DNA-3-methyladenine glycosylase I [Eubacteriales bacterium]
MAEKIRCRWCCDGGMMQKYHDGEWGIPLHDDQKQFEFLMMEVMQCGLSWNLMLKKREIFRQCFDGFDFRKIAEYGEEEIRSIMETEGMIRSERKIRAVIHNARCFLQIIEEHGSFDSWLWGYTQGKSLVYRKHREGFWEAKNELSDRIAADLKKYGFKYLGSITVYSHLQAAGIINDHEYDCWMYPKLTEGETTEYVEG